MPDMKLVEALVGEHVEQYQNNPMFRNTIQTLAGMLPIWVDGLATATENSLEKLQLLEKYYKGQT